MIELARGGDGRFGLAVGGDTFNTAVYLARAGISTSYIMALGDDPYSQAVIDMAAAENVDSSAISRLAGRLPGLYLIETDDTGERSFYYWRETSPAREVFSNGVSSQVHDMLTGASLIYFSGISLWLYERDGMGPFLEVLAEARQRGARIAFDSNYRPRLWGANKEPVRNAFAYAAAIADIVLPSLDDERALGRQLSRGRAATLLPCRGQRDRRQGRGGGCLYPRRGRRRPAHPGARRADARGHDRRRRQLQRRLSGRAPRRAGAS
jgi:2-dehydro-3-deoxygluconokinase